MYANFDILADIEPDAEAFVIDNDRALYRPLLARVEKFCSENAVLIGGDVSLDMLAGRPMTRNSYQWDLYCEENYQLVKNLADELAKVECDGISSRTVVLLTDIKQREFTIRVNTRALLHIRVLDRHRGIRLSNLMIPATRPGYITGAPVKLIGEEIQLITVYRNLYTPKKAGLWDRELKTESVVYGFIRDSMAKRALNPPKTGGRANFGFFEKKIISDVLANSPNIVVGDYALRRMGVPGSNTRLQFIAADAIDSVATSIERSIASDRGSIQRKIVPVKYPLNIPGDFQTTKYTLYLCEGVNKTAIADVYNSTSFEMVPWGDGGSGLKIGSPWVLLRFLMIDVWVLKLILSVGTGNREFIQTRLLAVIEDIDNLRDIVSETLRESPANLFQLTNYAGVYIDESVAKKKLIKEADEFYPPYYPAKALPKT